MSKFKVGDHVRATRPDHPTFDQVGEVINVGLVPNAFAVAFPASSYLLFTHELVLADPDRAEPAPIGYLALGAELAEGL